MTTQIELKDLLDSPEGQAALREAGLLPPDAVPRSKRLTIEDCHHHAVPLLAELSRKGLNRGHQRQVLRKAIELLDRTGA
jgi:hypothetical protein